MPNITWQFHKPDRDGLWIYRVPNQPPARNGVGVIQVKGSSVTELGTTPVIKYDMQYWWYDDFPMLTYYVGLET